MGNFFIKVPKSEGLDAVVAKYQLSQKHVKRLWWLFNEADRDGSFTLSLTEFNHFFTERASAFLDHLLFLAVEKSESSTFDITFVEFVEMISTICLYDEEEMCRFSFETFDEDGNGNIDKIECAIMLQELTKYIETNNVADLSVADAIHNIDKDGDGEISFEEFSELNADYPHLLWPAYRLQFRMQEQTLGVEAWQKQARKLKGHKRLACSCLLLPGDMEDVEPVDKSFWKHGTPTNKAYVVGVGPIVHPKESESISSLVDVPELTDALAVLEVT